jgi:predicted RNase H-like HicB family nuclease
VGEGDSYEAALADVQSAIRFHLETLESKPSRLTLPFSKCLLRKPK